MATNDQNTPNENEDATGKSPDLKIDIRAALFGPAEQEALAELTYAALTLPMVVEVVQIVAKMKPGKKQNKALKKVAKAADKAVPDGDAHMASHQFWNSITILRPLFSKEDQDELLVDLAKLTVECLSRPRAEDEGFHQ